MSEVRAPVVDAAIHPAPREVEGIRAYMSPTYRQLSFPRPFRYLYPAPTGVPPYGEFRDDSRVDGGMPGSDIQATQAFLDESGTDLAILVPLTRGLMPNLDLGSEICAATNAWLADTWLAGGAASRRFRGSIRVNPEDPERAVAEIERWAGHPGFVQVAVPLESHHPYGHRLYRLLWEAAAAAGLPVAVHSDGGAGTDFPPTPNGYPRFYVEYLTLYPVNFIYHLSSLIAEGVFDRVPDLRFVFADGDHDMLVPLMWRMDVDWPISRMETPWVSRRPTEYLRDHVRFVSSRLEEPPAELAGEWYEMTGAADLVLFGSNYPHWTAVSPAKAFAALPPDRQARITGWNALEFYARIQAAGVAV